MYRDRLTFVPIYNRYSMCLSLYSRLPLPCVFTPTFTTLKTSFHWIAFKCIPHPWPKAFQLKLKIFNHQTFCSGFMYATRAILPQPENRIVDCCCSSYSLLCKSVELNTIHMNRCVNESVWVLHTLLYYSNPFCVLLLFSKLSVPFIVI